MALVIKLQHVGAWKPSTDLIKLDKEGRSELAIDREIRDSEYRLVRTRQ